MAKDKLSRKDKRLYDKHLREVRRLDPDVEVILDVTEEDTDWLRHAPKGDQAKEGQ
jgi:hypothetical protein